MLIKRETIQRLFGFFICAFLFFVPFPATPSANPSSDLQASDAWEVMAPLPEGRYGLAVIADGNGHIYALGGISSIDAFSGVKTIDATNYRYNIAADTWDVMAPIPVPLADIDAGLVGGKIYIPGDGTTSTTYVYDIAANAWSEIPENGGYYPRFMYKVAVIGTDLYVLGGCCDIDDGLTLLEVWVLDTITETWSPGIPLLYSGESFAAGVIGDKIYIAGGKRNDDRRTAVETFDGDKWTNIGEVPSCGDGCYGWDSMADAASPQGLWFAGGDRGFDGHFLDHAAFYDPGTNSWTTSPEIPPLNFDRTHLSGDIADDGYFYVIGGRAPDGEILATNERLLIASDPLAQTPLNQTFIPFVGR